ncbi:MAG: hypothetical protein ACKODG_06475, partial [Betaproteobacteria bacterium]
MDRSKNGSVLDVIQQLHTVLSMTALKGFAWILVFQCVGEVIAQGVSGLWPGPVIGMLLLAFAL